MIAPLRLIPVQLRSQESLFGFGTRNRIPCAIRGVFAAPPLRHCASQLGIVVISKVKERRRRRILFPLKDHGNKRSSENQRCRELCLANTGNRIKPVAKPAIAYLIVILYVSKKSMRAQTFYRPSMNASPVLGILTVINIDRRKRLGQLRERSKIAIVAAPLASEKGEKRVMKVVAPLSIDAVSASRTALAITASNIGSHDTRIIQIALGDQHELSFHFFR